MIKKFKYIFIFIFLVIFAFEVIYLFAVPKFKCPFQAFYQPVVIQLHHLYLLYTDFSVTELILEYTFILSISFGYF